MIVTKNNGRKYLYRPERRGDKVVKRYVGGLNDVLPAIIHKHDQLRRAIESESSKNRRKTHAILQGVIELVRLNEMRLRQLSQGHPEFPLDILPPLNDAERHLLSDLAQRASGGSKPCLTHLHDRFHCHPRSLDAVALVNGFVKDRVLEVLAEGDPTAHDILGTAIDRQRGELIAMCDSPLAVVAADHVVTCWLTVALCLARSATGAYVKSPAKGDEIVSDAQRRLVEAISLFDRIVNPPRFGPAPQN